MESTRCSGWAGLHWLAFAWSNEVRIELCGEEIWRGLQRQIEALFMGAGGVGRNHCRRCVHPLRCNCLFARSLSGIVAVLGAAIVPCSRFRVRRGCRTLAGSSRFLETCPECDAGSRRESGRWRHMNAVRFAGRRAARLPLRQDRRATRVSLGSSARLVLPATARRKRSGSLIVSRLVRPTCRLPAVTA